MGASRRAALVLGGLLVMIACGCSQRMQPPAGAWIPDDNVATQAVKGAEIELFLRGGERVAGELIVYGPDSLHVLTGAGLRTVHRQRILRSRLVVTPPAGKPLVVEMAHRRRDMVSDNPAVPERYARFPAGWPAGVDRSAILLGRDAPADTSAR